MTTTNLTPEALAELAAVGITRADQLEVVAAVADEVLVRASLETVPLGAGHLDVYERNRRVFEHELATGLRDHDEDGECCRRAAAGSEPS